MLTLFPRGDVFPGIMNGENVREVLGDCPNLEIPADADSFFWETKEERKGWKLQKGIITGRYRIVDDCGTQKGNGTGEAMREKMRRLTRREFLQAGDIVGVPRVGMYEHYGIYLGNGRVIQYAGESADFDGRISVHEASFQDFLKGSEEYFVVCFGKEGPLKIQSSTNFLFHSCMDGYTEAFRSRKWKVFSDEETVKRAYSRLGEEHYSLANNNCEHFVMWCKTGVSVSSQVKRITEYGMGHGYRGRSDGKWLLEAVRM